MKRLLLLLAAAALPALVSSCGLFGNSDEQAIVGGGAIAGKDYVCGLQPSDNAREFFNSLSDDAPIETVRRTGGNESKSGVRFVNNGGILIPPGVTISFDNHGYCMDPHLPAPKSGEDYQLVPMSRLIPEELTDTYKNLIAQESAGNSAVRSNMQHLVWALRTAGTDAPYANNLTPQEKQILDQCSDGIFESFHESKKNGNKIINELLNMADSVLNVTIGGVTYKASDLLDPDIGSKKINEHINQLIDLSEYLPVENIGLNYGEIEPGIYTDVVGTGYLQYHAKIANATNQPYIFYPSDWVGQVGSPAKSSGVFAAADSTMRQRVTGKNPNEVKVEDKSKEKKKCDYCDGFTPFNEMEKIKEQYLRNYIQAERNRRMQKVLFISNSIFFGIPNFFATDQKASEFATERALEVVLDDTPLGFIKQGVDYYNTMKPAEDAVQFWRKKLDNITWKCPKCKRTHGPLGGFMIPDFN